jgi:hypothetical protein
MSECSIASDLTDVELETAAKVASAWPKSHGEYWRLPDGRL